MENAAQLQCEGTIYAVGFNLLNPVFGSAQAGLLAAFMTAQSKNESTVYTSHVFNTYKNAFGYGYKGGSIYKDYTNQNPCDYGATDVANWIIKRKADFANAATCLDYATALYNNDYFEGESAQAYANDMLANYIAPSGIIPVLPKAKFKLAYAVAPLILIIGLIVKA